MALHLNLNHEIEKDKLAKARDPLKLGMIALGAIAALFALYYLWQQTAMHGINTEYEQAKAGFEKVEKAAEDAEKSTEELTQVVMLSEAFTKRIEGRFYWASLLDQVTKLAQPDIQITRLSGEMQPDASRRCTINIEGISAGADPRKTAEGLRKALEEEFSKQYKTAVVTFRSLEDGTASVLLGGVSQPTALYQITIQLGMGEDVAPKVAPRRAKGT